VSQTQLPPVQPYHPTTFLERGVAIPFTTPLLGGTRARPASKPGLELIVSNPSGGRGVYIMPWPSVATLCRPTLHDRVFNTRIGRLDFVTPAVIRQIAREIAVEGLAGEAAMEAARLAADSERDDKVATNYELLMSLIEQNGPCLIAANLNDPEAEKILARQTISRVAPRLNQSTAWTASALEALAEVMTDTGMGAGTAGRIPRLIDGLRRTRAEIADWTGTRKRDDQAAYGRMIGTVADVTLALADNVLSQVHALTREMVGLLRTWAADPASVVQLASRPEWLLDGWEKICFVWNYAQDDVSRRMALLEIVDLVPVLPREARDWCDRSFDIDGAMRFRRNIRLNEDWRTGENVLALIARNEHFRAAAC
jgi:hypothetical protein